MNLEFSTVGGVPQQVSVSPCCTDRNSQARWAAVRFKVLCRFHQDPVFTDRLLSRLERLGVSCKAPGLQAFTAAVRADLEHEIRRSVRTSLVVS